MISRIFSYGVLRRPRASRLGQRAQASSKGSSFEMQAGEAGLEWRVPWRALVGAAVVFGVTLAGVAREVHTTAAAQGHQLNTHGLQLDRLEKGLNEVAERLEKSIAAGHSELQRNADKDRSELQRNADKDRSELQRNADKDRRDLLQAIDRLAEVRVLRGVLGSPPRGGWNIPRYSPRSGGYQRTRHSEHSAALDCSFTARPVCELYAALGESQRCQGPDEGQ